MRQSLLLQQVFLTGEATHFEMAKTEGGKTAWYSGRIGPISNEMAANYIASTMGLPKSY